MTATLLIGLGNPGPYYEHTRHNFGFVAADALGRWLDVHSFRRDPDLSADIAERGTPSGKVILAKPTTFMNESGSAVQKLVAYYKVPLTQLWILHDDLDLLPGDLRHAFDARSAGHNGVQSIIDALGSQAFHRLRIGIGSARAAGRTAEAYVLATPDVAEQEKLSMQKLFPRMRAMLSEYVPAFAEERGPASGR